MFKIIRKDSQITTIDEFKLSEFSEGTAKEKVKKDSSFVPSHETEGTRNFIKGGFDFDYEGGLSKEEIINHSNKIAEQIVQKANEDAEAIRDEAKAVGLEEGKKTGYEEGKDETRPVIGAFNGLVDELKSVRKQFYDNAEEEMIHLVINVAKAVIGEAVKNDPSLVRHAIGKAVAQLQNKEEMTIHLNSEDLAEAQKFRPELAKMVESIEKVTFKGDPHFARGGCMVETNIGSIDARVGTQLDAIAESFINAVKEKKAEATPAQTGTQPEPGDDIATEDIEPVENENKDGTGDEG